MLVLSAQTWAAEAPNTGGLTLNADLSNPGAIELPGWFKNSFLDLREDVAEAAEAGKRLMLYFYQDGCPYCKKLIQVNLAQKAIEEKARAGFEVIAINMWGDRELTDLDGRVLAEKEFAAGMKVMFTPTLLFLDEKGGQVLRVNGYYHPTKFAAALDYVAKKREGKESFRDYYARLDPPAPKGELHRQPFFLKSPLDLSNSKTGFSLVLFEQLDCPACDEFHEDVVSRAETQALMKAFRVGQVDMWSKDEQVVTPSGKKMSVVAWAKELDIKYAPTLVFFDADGKEVFRAEAFLKTFHVQSALEYVSTGAYSEQPSFQRFIEGRADKLREQGVTIDLMN